MAPSLNYFLKLCIILVLYLIMPKRYRCMDWIILKLYWLCKLNVIICSLGLEKIEINLPKYQGLQSTAKANINSNIEQRLTFLEKSNLELEQKVSELEKENLDLITQLKAGRGVSAIILKSMDGYYLRTWT